LFCGTSAGAYSCLCHGQAFTIAGDFYWPALGVLTWRARVRPDLLASSNAAYPRGAIGLWMDNNAVCVPVYGIFFKIDYTVSPTNWVCPTMNGGTNSTDVDSGVAISNTAWTKLKLVTAADWSSVGFYINNTLVQTLTTNIPTAHVVPECIGYKNGAGATQFKLYVDWVRTKYVYAR
jgi:hypothetical protein